MLSKLHNHSIAKNRESRKFTSNVLRLSRVSAFLSRPSRLLAAWHMTSKQAKRHVGWLVTFTLRNQTKT